METHPQSPIRWGPAVVSLVSEDGGGGGGWEGGGPTGVICCQAAGTRSCCPRLDQACCGVRIRNDVRSLHISRVTRHISYLCAARAARQFSLLLQRSKIWQVRNSLVSLVSLIWLVSCCDKMGRVRGRDPLSLIKVLWPCRKEIWIPGDVKTFNSL